MWKRLCGIREAFWLGAAVCVWLLFWIDDPDRILAAALLAGIWFSLRFRKTSYVLMWLALCLMPYSNAWRMRANAARLPEKGEYTITQIRSCYAVASTGKDQVLVYEKDRLSLDEQIVVRQFEPVHTSNNPGLFSFQKYANDRGIFFSASKMERRGDSKPQTLRGRIWQWTESRKASSLYRLLFYGISESEELAWIGSLGLPMIGLFSVLRGLLKRRVDKSTAGWIVLGLELVCLVLFPVSPSLVRMACFGVCAQIFENRDRRMAFSILLFLFVCPGAARSMAFVLPSGILLAAKFQTGRGGKKLVQTAFGIICQMAFLGRVNLFLLAGFGSMRKMLGLFFIAALPGLYMQGYGIWLESVLQRAFFSFERFEIIGMAPWWYLLALGIWLLRISWKWKRVRALAGAAMLLVYPYVWKLDPFFHVYLLDVGQGDATVIVEPFQKSVVMIDAAGRFNHDNAYELYIPFFATRQITALDALVVTHGDFDHDGAVQSLDEQFEVKKIVTDSNEKVPVDYAFELLLAMRQADQKSGNDESLISFFSYDGFSYLWTGDASKNIEEQLIEAYDIQADILKAGHHGSKTSSSRAFLQALNCRLALISAGYRNRFDHPDREVLALMEELGIDRLNTADHGMIHISTLKGLMMVQSADGLTGFIRPAKRN